MESRKMIFGSEEKSESVDTHLQQGKVYNIPEFNKYLKEKMRTYGSDGFPKENRGIKIDLGRLLKSYVIPGLIATNIGMIAFNYFGNKPSPNLEENIREESNYEFGKDTEASIKIGNLRFTDTIDESLSSFLIFIKKSYDVAREVYKFQQITNKDIELEYRGMKFHYNSENNDLIDLVDLVRASSEFHNGLQTSNEKNDENTVEVKNE